jgi:hypothetical protein
LAVCHSLRNQWSSGRHRHCDEERGRGQHWCRRPKLRWWAAGKEDNMVYFLGIAVFLVVAIWVAVDRIKKEYPDE